MSARAPDLQVTPTELQQGWCAKLILAVSYATAKHSSSLPLPFMPSDATLNTATMQQIRAQQGS